MNEQTVGKPEFSGRRRLDYSRWRRTVKPGNSGKCYHLDLDWIEWRSRRGIVAFIETSLFYPEGRFTQEQILAHYKRFHVAVYGELAKLAGKPAFFVFFGKRLKKFWVYRLTNGTYKFLAKMNEERYREFIKGL